MVHLYVEDLDVDLVERDGPQDLNIESVHGAWSTSSGKKNNQADVVQLVSAFETTLQQPKNGQTCSFFRSLDIKEVNGKHQNSFRADKTRDPSSMGVITIHQFFSDLKFRALDVEAEVMDGGVAQGEEDGVDGKTLSVACAVQ